MSNQKHRKNRQKLKRQLLILILTAMFIPLASSGQTKIQNRKTEKTDYVKASNIIKHPENLTGDKKAIFYHPFFLKLTSEETRHLNPFKVKEEFAKLGITTDENDRFVDAYSFLKTYCWGHKKSCENFSYFDFLKPKPKN